MDVGEQAARLNTPHGYLVDRFRARDLHLVMGPAVRGTEVRFQVTLDDRPPGEDPVSMSMPTAAGR